MENTANENENIRPLIYEAKNIELNFIICYSLSF